MVNSEDEPKTMMASESPHRKSVTMKCPSLSAIGHEAQLSAPRSLLRSPIRKSTLFESPPLASDAQVVCPRSSPIKPIPYVGVDGHDALDSPSRRSHPTEVPTLDQISHEFHHSTVMSSSPKGSPDKEPILCAVVGHEAQLVTPERSPVRKFGAASLGGHPLKEMIRIGERTKGTDFQSQRQNPGEISSVAGDCSEILEFQASNNWVLHFATDVVKGSAFDEQVRGQLRTTGQSCKLGRLLDLVDVGTYGKLCNASVHDLIKLINHKLQTLKVHKKPCEDLFKYIKKIDELLSSLFKSLDSTNLSHGVHRLLGVLKESLADAYILFKRCETRSPIHVNVLSNIPAKLIAIEEEIQRIIPVLRLALAQHQDILTSQANMERVALGVCSDDSFSVSTMPNSATSSQRSTDVKYSRSETKVSGYNPSIQKAGLERQLAPRSKAVAPWRVDVHPLKMHRWGTRTYLCGACHQVGNGCVFSCDQCDYHVHPSCVELNEAIQQLEEIRINKLSMCGDSVNFDTDLCGMVR